MLNSSPAVPLRLSSSTLPAASSVWSSVSSACYAAPSLPWSSSSFDQVSSFGLSLNSLMAFTILAPLSVTNITTCCSLMPQATKQSRTAAANASPVCGYTISLTFITMCFALLLLWSYRRTDIPKKEHDRLLFDQQSRQSVILLTLAIILWRKLCFVYGDWLIDGSFLHCALSSYGQCIVVGPVCGFVCVCVCVWGGSVTTITRNCVYRSSPNWVCR